MFDGVSRRAAVFASLGLLAVLGGCATPPSAVDTQAMPGRLELRLAPAALGAVVSVQQHLRVVHRDRVEELDAVLEVDAQRVELVGLALGRRVLTVQYDGSKLRSWRHDRLPSQVRAEDVLSDLQLTLWPGDAIRQALPDGWSLRDDGLLRTLSQAGVPVTTVRYSAMPRWSGTAELVNLRHDYRLTIQSVPNSQ